MKLIPLTQGKFAQVDNSDYEWLMQWNWSAQLINGIWYAHRGVRLPRTGFRAYGKVIKILMHRQILGLKKRWELGDHEDGNGLNNQRYNLRKATNSQNLRNSRKRKNASCKYKGVSKINGKYTATIFINSRLKRLGNFDNEEMAALAYNDMAKKHFKEFARLNQISPGYDNKRN